MAANMEIELRYSGFATIIWLCSMVLSRFHCAAMERLMRAMNQEVPKQLRILELNPEHALVGKMKAMLEADPADSRLADYVDLLFGQALLGEGSTPKNPQRFNRLVAGLMANG